MCKQDCVNFVAALNALQCHVSFLETQKALYPQCHGNYDWIIPLLHYHQFSYAKRVDHSFLNKKMILIN